MVAIELSETDIWNPTAPLPPSARASPKEDRSAAHSIGRRPPQSRTRRRRPAAEIRPHIKAQPDVGSPGNHNTGLGRVPFEKPQRIPPPFPLLALLELLPRDGFLHLIAVLADGPRYSPVLLPRFPQDLHMNVEKYLGTPAT